MKTTIATGILAFLLTVSANGQFNTGGSYFSGASEFRLGLESTSTEFGSNDNAIVFGLSPEGGYFIQNRLAVGGSIQASLNRGLGEFGSTTYSFVFGPNVRYYLPRDTDLQIFLYGFAGYGFITDHQLLTFIAGPGINLFLTERIAFESRLLYAYSREWNPEFGGRHNVHDFTFMAGISLFFPTFLFETFGRGS